MYNLHAVTNSETFAEIPSNTYGLATLVLVAPFLALAATCLDSIIICSYNHLIMAG